MKYMPRINEWRSQAGIFLLALTVRLVYLYQSTSNPAFDFPMVDAGVYDLSARMIAAGKGVNYYNNFFWQAPFYPAFLALIYAGGHASVLWPKIFQAVLGGFCCLLTYRLGKQIFNPAVGMISGMIVIFYGPLIVFEQELLASGWAVFWSLGLMLLFINASKKDKWWTCPVLGCCGALSILTRPVFLPFFVTTMIWLTACFFQQEKSRLRPLLKLVLVLAGFCLIALPVAHKNRKITGRFGILPATGGINFFIGNNPDLTATVTARPGRDWRKLTDLPERNGVSDDMWEQQEYFFTRFTTFVRTQPLVFVRGLAYKSVQLFSSREIPRNIDIYLYRKWSPLLGVLVWKVKGFGFPFGVLLPLALVGLIGCRRQIPFPLMIYLLVNSLLLILIFVTARYRILMIPMMSIVAAAGLLKIIDMARSRKTGTLAVTGIGTAALILISTLPGPFPEEQKNFEPELYANIAAEELRNGRTDSAIGHLITALDLQPDYPSAHGNLGMALTRKGRYEEAINHFHIALELDDSAAEVHNNLASALSATNNIEQAIAHYYQAIKINPRYPEAHYNLGNLLYSKGKIKDAINQLQTAVQIDDDFFEAHNSLAVALARNDTPNKAIKHFRRAIRLQPYAKQPRYNLALTLAVNDNIDQAIAELTKLLTIHPRSPDVLDHLARLFISKKDADIHYATEAIKSAAKACRMTNYQRPDFLGTLAEAYAAAGDFARATAVARKGLEITTAAGRDDGTGYFRDRLDYYRTKQLEKLEKEP